MGRVWGILRIVLIATIAVTALGAALNWRNIHMIATYNPILLAPKYSKPETVAEARQQDLKYLRKLTSIDRSFSDDEKAEFTQFLNSLDETAATMSDAAFYLAVSRAAAIADNGHTNVSTQPLHRQFNAIGAKLYWFADGLFVVRADAAHADTVGRRVLAIDGAALDKVVNTLSPYRGGNEASRKLAMPMMMESPEIMHAAGLAASPDALVFTLLSEDGSEMEVSFYGRGPDVTAAPVFRRATMTLFPDALPGETDGWAKALQLDGSTAPLYLRDAGRPLFAPLPGNGHYIRTQSGFGTPEQSVGEFFEAALDAIEDGSLDYLVADYRWNSGGDYTRAIHFAKAAPLKLKADGRLYILVGPQTFSASIVTVAMLKYYGGEKSLIVGEPMGDRDSFWAETGMGFKLPNSGLNVNYATGFHDWNKGCRDHPYCYTLNRKHEVKAGSLAPAAMIAPSFLDYTSGRDVVMDWVETDQGLTD